MSSVMSRTWWDGPLILAAMVSLTVGGLMQPALARNNPAPELTHSSPEAWTNSPPLTLAQLRGKVVLLEFWTFDCVNCRRTLPLLKLVQQRYAGDGLVIVSVHSPEFSHERDAQNVREAVTRLGIPYAVMLDSDFSYWKAMSTAIGRPSTSSIGRG
jgi:thiol-disulfide isomerase/thioredoxin